MYRVSHKKLHSFSKKYTKIWINSSKLIIGCFKKSKKNVFIITYQIKIACIWGCSSTCTIESNYIRTGGTTSSLMSGTWTFLPVTPIS